jgi:multidrug efflux system outer membrane protein
VRAAEQALVTANAIVGVATADMFPTISLTGAFGGVAPRSPLLKDGKSWSAAPGFAPIFQGTPANAPARGRRAVAAGPVGTRNGDLALPRFPRRSWRTGNSRRWKSSWSVRCPGTGAVRLANQRYVSGLADYLEVLQAEQQLFPAEIALAQSRFDRLATLVQLYKALGGGWKLADQEWSDRTTASVGAQ